MHAIFGAAAAALLVAQAAPAPDPQLATGRKLAAQFLAGDGAALEPQLTAEFLAAVGGREGLVRLAGQVASEAGAEKEVLREAMFREAGHVSYYRRSRFEKLADVTILFIIRPDGKVAGASVRPSQTAAATPHAAYRTKAQLRLPFRRPAEGGLWYVGWGGRDPIDNYHVVATDQRYAYDFFVTRGEAVAKDKGERNEDHFCWGEPVVAPAAGLVVVSTDGVEDNERPGTQRPDVPPPGNHVVIDHGQGEHSLIAHFRRGTVAVRQGQQVRAGQVLGQCGNSGRSSMPHVHYHLQTGSAYAQGLGLPAFFNDYRADGRVVTIGEPVRGQRIGPAQPD